MPFCYKRSRGTAHCCSASLRASQASPHSRIATSVGNGGAVCRATEGRDVDRIIDVNLRENLSMNLTCLAIHDADAHRMLEAGGVIGKIVLHPA